MKKFLFILVFIFLITIIISFITLKNKEYRKNIPLAGSDAKDFIIGMKDSTIYKLSYFIGKYNVILTFLDTSPQSKKTENVINSSKLKSFMQNNNDIIWFNILKDSSRHIIIEEKTEKINLSYRTLPENIPKFYNFKNFPTIVIINKEGIVHLVYSGYSPTLINDILNMLKTIVK